MWTGIIDSPIFSIFYSLVLVGSILLGYYLALHFYRQRNKTWEKSGVESSLIGFFALVISFTLSSAYSSSNERNRLIHEQGDALSQIHHESLLLPPPLALNVKQYLLRHIDAQMLFYQHRIQKDSVIKLITLQNQNFFNSMRSDSMAKKDLLTLIPSYNFLSSTTFRMLYSYDERTPPIVIFLLVISSWLIGLLVGFLNGFHKSKHILVPLLYFIMVSLTMQAIRDLDNPAKGGIRPQYSNLQDLQIAIRNNF